jgi:hypothetical protein
MVPDSPIWILQDKWRGFGDSLKSLVINNPYYPVPTMAPKNSLPKDLKSDRTPIAKTRHTLHLLLRNLHRLSMERPQVIILLSLFGLVGVICFMGVACKFPIRLNISPKGIELEILPSPVAPKPVKQTMAACQVSQKRKLARK